MLRLFLDFVVVEEPDPRLSSEQKSWSTSIIPDETIIIGSQEKQKNTPPDQTPVRQEIRLYLGNDFMSRFGNKPFDMYMTEG
jgi:hypothetical protein